MSIDLSKEMKEILDDYTTEINEATNRSIEETAKALVKDLRETSPKKTGKYAKGWVSTKGQASLGVQQYVVHNKKYYRLTHLLEYGHVKRGGTGRVAPRPHIAAAEDRAAEYLEQSFEREMKR